MNSSDTQTFGHLEPLSPVAFDASGRIFLTFRPEPQVLICAKP